MKNSEVIIMKRQSNTIRTFINRNVERHMVREYLLRETERAGFGGLEFNRTPEGTKVTLSAEQVGRVIGRRGKVIHELQHRLKSDFKLENPRLEVNEIEEPRLNAQVMASRLASSLERGWFFRRAGHSTAQNIMDAGARGCLIILSGKISGARHRVQKFQQGHIKFCGETALQFMDEGFSTAVKKLGTVGCTVRIMRPGVKLPHEIDIIERVDSGLGPIEEVSMLEIPEESEEAAPVAAEESSVDADEVIDSVVEKMADLEAASETEAVEEVTEETEEDSTEDSAEEASEEAPEEATEEAPDDSPADSAEESKEGE
ncbi:MAG: 30S ribosomal protein S3 [Methanobacteriota archaeon]|nr:MAG: 30S ribosomal protein S3 [Euryarchaeota archaeon]